MKENQPYNSLEVQYVHLNIKRIGKKYQEFKEIVIVCDKCKKYQVCFGHRPAKLYLTEHSRNRAINTKHAYDRAAIKHEPKLVETQEGQDRIRNQQVPKESPTYNPNSPYAYQEGKLSQEKGYEKEFDGISWAMTRWRVRAALMKREKGKDRN